MGRAGGAAEIASTAVLLAWNMGSYITGETIRVDGGAYAASGWYRQPQPGEFQLEPR
ncbi:SDR family oxidoreductase [Mycobacterium botniense]|uniref:SDR family oxidoreductase n=1 Tax=Mycobacterium botniense TaxID=84962 RepID=UPI0013D706CB|nr:SDR family oxidoreductase [Mycobacterium botniense]